MRTMQEKLLARIEDTVKAAKFEAVQAANYSNTGTVHIQDPKFYQTQIEVAYDFQPGTCRFHLTVQGVKILSQPPRPDYFTFYQDYSDAVNLANFFAALEKGLEAIR